MAGYGKKNSVFSHPNVGSGGLPGGPQTQGNGLPNATNSDILQPELYAGHQQPGPAGPGTPSKSFNSVFSAGSQAQPMGGIAAGQSGLARRFAGKLGAAGRSTPKVSPGFPAGLYRGK